jgi:large subunit ribosomal protein L21
MYAIIRTGGKQYRVKAGDTVKVESLNAELGSEIDGLEVLLIGGGEKTFIGTPTVTNGKVKAVVTQNARGPKIVVFKKKRRQGYRRTIGHRQQFTELFIAEISSPEGEVVKADGKPVVIDPVAKAERQAKLKEQQLKAKKEAKQAGEKLEKKNAKKKAAKKAKTTKKVAAKKAVVAKKAAKKKAAKKKAATKKTVTKKTTKKAAKKTTKKKASK